MPATIVHAAYDLTGEFGWIYDQTLWSALSLVAAHGGALPAGLRVAIYTDDPARWAPIDAVADVRVWDRRALLEAMGPSRFMHRLKLAMLIDAAKRASGPILYLDGDTIIRRPLDEPLAWLAPGRSLMHAREREIGEAHDRRDRQTLDWIRRSSIYPSIQNRKVWLFNAGVVGLHPADFPLLPEARSITDMFLSMNGALDIEQSHLWEQIAVSITLGLKTEVHPTDEWIHHYWDQREAFTEAITPRLAELRARKATLAEAAADLRDRPIQVAPPRRPGLLVRALRKLAGRSRMISRRIQDKIRELD